EGAPRARPALRVQERTRAGRARRETRINKRSATEFPNSLTSGTISPVGEARPLHDHREARPRWYGRGVSRRRGVDGGVQEECRDQAHPSEPHQEPEVRLDVPRRGAAESVPPAREHRAGLRYLSYSRQRVL